MTVILLPDGESGQTLADLIREIGAIVDGKVVTNGFGVQVDDYTAWAYLADRYVDTAPAGSGASDPPEPTGPPPAPAVEEPAAPPPPAKKTPPARKSTPAKKTAAAIQRSARNNPRS